MLQCRGALYFWPHFHSFLTRTFQVICLHLHSPQEWIPAVHPTFRLDQQVTAFPVRKNCKTSATGFRPCYRILSRSVWPVWNGSDLGQLTQSNYDLFIQRNITSRQTRVKITKDYMHMVLPKFGLHLPLISQHQGSGYSLFLCRSSDLPLL